MAQVPLRILAAYLLHAHGDRGGDAAERIVTAAAKNQKIAVLPLEDPSVRSELRAAAEEVIRDEGRDSLYFRQARNASAAVAGYERGWRDSEQSTYDRIRAAMGSSVQNVHTMSAATGIAYHRFRHALLVIRLSEEDLPRTAREVADRALALLRDGREDEAWETARGEAERRLVQTRTGTSAEKDVTPTTTHAGLLRVVDALYIAGEAAKDARPPNSLTTAEAARMIQRLSSAEEGIATLKERLT